MGQTSTKKDFDEFNSIWLQHHEVIYKSILYALCDNKEAVVDVLHNAYLKAALAWGNLRNKEKAGAWFHRIAVNAVKEYFRKEKKYIPIENDVLYAKIENETDEIQSDIDIKELIQSIPEPWSTFIYMKYELQFTDKEIAGMYNLSYSTVRKRLYRYVKRLEEAL